jgi:hypothetical protein
LRLWMIGRQLPAVRDPKRQNKEKNFEELMRATCKQLGNLITDGGYFSIIIGDTRRGSPKCNTDAVIRSIFETVRYSPMSRPLAGQLQMVAAAMALPCR